MTRTTGSTVQRDSQRAKVYAAEASWEARLDAARRGARRAVVAGSALLLPQERHFGTLSAAQDYADDLVCRLHLPPVRLRERRGPTKAHWEPPGVIALPLPRHGTSWAMREAVLLHELAHHADAHARAAVDVDVDGLEPARHGAHFTRRLLALVEDALGPEAAFALRVDFAEGGVAVAAAAGRR